MIYNLVYLKAEKSATTHTTLIRHFKQRQKIKILNIWKKQ